jgi:hypothetical protein
MFCSKIKITLSAVLAIYYMSTLWILKNPSTSQEYKGHFTNRVSDCGLTSRTASSKELPDEIDFPSISNRESCRYLRWGWSPISKRGSEANSFNLKLNVPYKPDTKALQLIFNEPPNRQEAVRVALAGTTTETEIHVSPEQETEVTLPVGAPGNDTQWHLDISFDMPLVLWNKYEAAPRGERHMALKMIKYVPQ